ncbi:hypothetical protein M404DRAFT_970207 [Pisolithus tinctorius Marx 270]|uniref:Uncharacterized protein n=1 Tax=Pisolithus tinctorius Marx 270 TaxID=870435 RepID=A0A0C3ILN3_PISTI|nr:hypothetical protein M404DRAFT_970207 [Pisolithus tinctorius Marx 270]
MAHSQPHKSGGSPDRVGCEYTSHDSSMCHWRTHYPTLGLGRGWEHGHWNRSRTSDLTAN